MGRVSDISNLLGSDWIKLARELEIDDQDINLIISEYPDNVGQQAMVMLRLWLNTEGNKATGNALEKALKQCDRQDIVNKCMFNIEMVTDNAEQEVAQSVLAREEGYDAFKKELSPVNNSTMKPLTRDYSIDVNVDESEYAHEQFVAAERLAGITEEISSRSDTINETSLKQEEATSVYEREEQKYIAEEKEFASSYHKEVQQEQISTNQIMQSQVLESTHRENNIITEKMENRNDYLHEQMNKMSIEEKQSLTIKEGDKVMEKTTESKMEEEHKEKEMYKNEMSETKESKTEERDDGTVLILTDTKKQSREAFMSESHDTRHYEQAQIMTGGDPEAVTVTESKFESETFNQGLDEQYSANVEERVETIQKEASNELIDERKVKYRDFGLVNKSATADNSIESFSVNRLINKFQNNLSAAPPGFDDHAIVDEVDVRKLSVILGHEPENKELADIQDNKTDDDQPDLETDESSGEKSKIKLDVSMEGFTEATDITTPVEMVQESAPSKKDDFDTSYQISDIPAELSKYDNKITSPATLHRETLFEITDLEDLTDIEETKEDIFVQQSSRSDKTLVAETSPQILDSKIKRREKNIDRKFDRLSMDLSDTEMNVEKEMLQLMFLENLIVMQFRKNFLNKVPPHPDNHVLQVLHLMMKSQNQSHLGPLHQKFLQDQNPLHLGFHSIIHILICQGSLVHRMVNLVEHPQMEALEMTWTI